MYPSNRRSLDIIIEEINVIREKMINSGLLNGLTNETTLMYSQELDGLIYEYQQNYRPLPSYPQEINPSIHSILYWTEAVC
ncbi:MAG: aspartyl-phosphate phosphatase Spo0E family protein [Bacillota bacterium]|nr:aspartyl-phosphate phosphatase Spo0E family protein [Bacillota bacterium]